MTAIHEVQQILTVNTPYGLGQVLFIVDYGMHQNSIWICASFEDGKIRHFDTSQISISINHTFNFNMKNQ
jgi:hypothetical protein